MAAEGETRENTGFTLGLFAEVFYNEFFLQMMVPLFFVVAILHTLLLWFDPDLGPLLHPEAEESNRRPRRRG